MRKRKRKNLVSHKFQASQTSKEVSKPVSQMNKPFYSNEKTRLEKGRERIQS